MGIVKYRGEGVGCGHVKHSDMGGVKMEKNDGKVCMGPYTRVDEFGTLSMVIGRILGQSCMRRDRLRVGGMRRVVYSNGSKHEHEHGR